MKKKPKKKKAKPGTKSKAKPKAKKALRAKPRPKKAKKAGRTPRAGKKTAAPKPKSSVVPPPNSVLAGRVEDYFAKIGVIAFTVKKPVNVGDHLHILGHTTDFEQTLDSLQIDHKSVAAAGVNDAVGIKVPSRVRRGDHVFIIRA